MSDRQTFHCRCGVEIVGFEEKAMQEALKRHVERCEE